MGSTIQFKHPDQVGETEQENTLKYEANNVTTLATTVDALVKKQNYKVEQKLNLGTKPKSSTPCWNVISSIRYICHVAYSTPR